MLSDIVYDFGIRLKELRNRRGLTQKEVAKKFGVDKNTISKYENNTSTPSLNMILELAVLYNTSLDYIVNISDRTQIYIDDLPQNQQELVLAIIEQIREKLSSE